MGYSPWGHKELDTTKQFHFYFSIVFPSGSDACLQCGRPGFDPWVGKIP